VIEIWKAKDVTTWTGSKVVNRLVIVTSANVGTRCIEINSERDGVRLMSTMVGSLTHGFVDGSQSWGLDESLAQMLRIWHLSLRETVPLREYLQINGLLH
jgi:hypothetical protein